MVSYWACLLRNIKSIRFMRGIKGVCCSWWKNRSGQTCRGYTNLALWRQQPSSIIFIALGKGGHCYCPIIHHAKAQMLLCMRRSHLPWINWGRWDYEALPSVRKAAHCHISLPKSNYTQRMANCFHFMPLIWMWIWMNLIWIAGERQTTTGWSWQTSAVSLNQMRWKNKRQIHN